MYENLRNKYLDKYYTTRPSMFKFVELLNTDSKKQVRNQLLQLCTARTVFSILVTVRIYTVMPVDQQKAEKN